MDSTDCDDGDDVVYPGAPEICDGQYNNCNDTSYNANSAAVERDGDSDNYVDCAYNVSTWVGSGSVIGGNDCDDSENTVYPTAVEICDGQLNNCNSNAIPSNETDDDSDGYVGIQLMQLVGMEMEVLSVVMIAKITPVTVGLR